MAVGKRSAGRQDEMFVATSEIRRLSHPFYQALERMLKNEGFDAFAEATCREFYAEKNGRPGIPPGMYFRMLLIGYLEGIGSERGIAWRCADSISLRDFLGYGLSKNPPDHSSVSRTRRRLSLEAHEAVFGWVLERLHSSGLLSGKTLGVDATTLEANAALRSIVRRDDGTGYEDWLEELAQASGIDTPTRAELAKLDRKRPKKGSNDDWTHLGDPEARITKMKDGRTHLAHKLEQASDMDSGAVVAVTVQTMDGGDCASMPVTLDEAGRQLSALAIEPREAVADKGYHSNATMKRLKAGGLRSYVSEPDRGRRSWKRDPDAKDPTYANRRRVRGARGKRQLRRRGEILERAFAHLLETGGLRRVHLRGQENIRKRMLVHAAAFNLGLLMRSRFGCGTPRAMQGHAIAQAELAKRAARAAIRPVIRLTIRFLSIFPPKMGRSSKLKTNKFTHVHLRSPFRGYESLASKAGFATGC
ncbi:MAG: transposase [Gammaproteobacteria bacterium]|nr:transposase [Gammaproteobacteria bacterium]